MAIPILEVGAAAVFGLGALAATVFWFVNDIKAYGWLMTAMVLWITSAFYATQINADDFSYERPSTETVYYLRWVFYAPACGFLMLEYARWLNLKDATLPLYLFTVLTLLTGAAASLRGPEELWFWAWTGLGFVFYGASLVLLVSRGNTKKNRNNGTAWLVWTVFGWLVYPLVFVLGHAGFQVPILPLGLENIIYAIGDLAFKFVIPFVAQFNIECAEKPHGKKGKYHAI